MKIYLAGRMSNMVQFNFPRFDEAARDLRVKGWTVVSPAELDDPETRKAALESPDGSSESLARDETWGDFLARDVKLIADEGVEGIICLEDWWLSTGARLETFIARLLQLPILKYSDLLPVTGDEIEKAHHLGAQTDSHLAYRRAA